MIGTRRLRQSRLRSYLPLQQKLQARLALSSGSLRRIRVAGLLYISPEAALTLDAKLQNLTLDLRHAKFIFPPDATPANGQLLLKLGNTDAPPETNQPKLVYGATANTGYLMLNDELIVGHYYFVYDPQSIEKSAATPFPTRKINGELIKVIAYDEINERYTVTPKFARSYANTSNAAHVTDRVCENITFLGGKFVGKDAADFLGWIATGYVQGLRFRFVKGVNSRITGIDAVTSRNVSFYRCSAKGVKIEATGTGNGYAFLVDRCTDVTMEGCQIENSRDGILLDCGTSAFTATSCFCYYQHPVEPTKTNDSFIDLHGGDNLNVTISNCVGQGQKLQLGNGSWRKGCKNVSVNNCVFGEIELWAGARSITISNTSCSHVTLNATESDPNFSTPKNYPEQCTFDNCTISSSASIDGLVQAGNNNYLPPQNQYYGIVFNNCQLTHTQGQCGFYTRKIVGLSNIYFNGCTFTLSGASIKPGLNMGSADDGNNDNLNVRWTNTHMIIADSRLVGAGCDDTTFWNNDNNNAAQKNKRGPSAGSLRDISESEDFENVSWMSP